MPDNFEDDLLSDKDNPFKKTEYEVGYGKPPRQHQFQKGNKAAAGPRRTQSRKSLRRAIADALNERVTVVHHGKRKRMTQAEALARLIVAKSKDSVPDAIRVLTLGMRGEPEEFQNVEPAKVTIEFVNFRPQGLPGADKYYEETRVNNQLPKQPRPKNGDA